MNYIVKQVNQEVANNDYYELFTTETIKDIDGNEVVVPRSVGQFSISQLENEKLNLQNAITEIDNKISAINGLE